MEEDVLFANVSSEFLEIYKYLDDSIKSKFPKTIEENFKKLYNKNHIFNYDVNKSLKEQDALLETKQLLVILFLKYCCTKEERDEILLESSKKFSGQNREQKINKNTNQNIFNFPKPTINYINNEIQEEHVEQNNKIIEYEEPQNWFSKLMTKLKNLIIKRRT